MQHEPSSSIFPSPRRQDQSCAPAQASVTASDGGLAPHQKIATTPLAAPRLLSTNGNVDDKPIPDNVEVPHEETDDDFKSTLIDSESESEDEIDFGDNVSNRAPVARTDGRNGHD